jgi:serine/threonine-protein kinase RsbW
MNSIITLTLPSDVIFTRFASQTAERAALLMLNSCDADTGNWQFVHAFELAVSEAFANAVTNAEQPGTLQTVIINFIFEQQRLTVTVRDTNQQFSTETPTPDIDSYPEKGYGLLLIRTVMDNVSCIRENGANILSMSKQL